MASTYTIKNITVYPVWVIMDSNREAHLIQPAGQAVFVKANPFDRPTWHVHSVESAGGVGIKLTSRKAKWRHIVLAEGTYTFNGSSLA